MVVVVLWCRSQTETAPGEPSYTHDPRPTTLVSSSPSLLFNISLFFLSSSSSLSQSTYLTHTAVATLHSSSSLIVTQFPPPPHPTFFLLSYLLVHIFFRFSFYVYMHTDSRDTDHHLRYIYSDMNVRSLFEGGASIRLHLARSQHQCR